RPLNLVVWCVGAATALGVPFFGGFVARHLITAGTLAGTKLGVPLLGLAWLGDALFALALIRATVLAFKSDPDDLAEGGAEKPAASRISELLELPGAALAVIGLALGVFPQTFLNLGALFAVDQFTPEGAASSVLRIVPFGYSTGNSQWLPGIFWLAALVLTAAILLIRLGTHRTAVTLETTGDDHLTGMEHEALDEPAVVWVDLASAFTSSWTQVAGGQLIGGIDEDDEYAEAQLDVDEDENDSDDGSGPDATIPPADSNGHAATPEDVAPADGVTVAEHVADGATSDADDAPAQETAETSAIEPKAKKQTTRKAGQRGQTRK
ncbi:MAG TPA: hypothetical protein VJR48_14590, partial [Ktedonobacterales bacterium]|nr:hypothetical protein [Ktedonobacterales bacterium]